MFIKKNSKLVTKNEIELESFIDSLIDSIPAALLITDNSDNILLFNKTFIQLWQIPLEILETADSREIFDFLDTKLEQRTFFKNKTDYLKESWTEASFSEINHKNGSIIECYTAPRWIKNKVCGRIWSFRNVSEQKQSEQLLVSQKQELINAHRIAMLGSWTYHLLSKEFKASESYKQMCEGLLVHKTMESFLSVVHSDDVDTVEHFFNDIFAEQITKGKVLKYKIVNNKGDIYYLKTIVELEYDGKIPILISGITQDVSQQTLLEKSLASAKEAAEDYNIAKDNIFSNISHEMRTPLNAILGYTRILSQISKDELQKDYINSIMSSGESMLSLIEDILYISKTDNENVNIKEDQVSIRNVVNEVRGIFQQKFSKKGIDFRIAISKEIPEYIIIDKLKIKQILVNLISNSLKFTEKGHVIVKFEGKAISYNQMFDLTIYVEDTGIGIEEKNKKKIFDSFLQIESSAKRNYEGTGLGLYITKRNVDFLGGTINLHSAPKKGSIFVVNLKNLKIHSIAVKYRENDRHKIDAIQFEEASILVADDQEFNREILRYLLSQFNFEVFEVENGNDAILLAEKFKPSLIVMDLKMPKMDGYNALKKLRKNPETTDIPIIAFSSYEKGVNRENLLKFGFSDFLSKPVTFSKTIKILCKFLDYKNIDTKGQRDFLMDFKEILNDERNKSLLKKNLFNSWEKLNQKKTMKEQLEFANKLVGFGQDNKLDFIERFGELLIQSLKVYDVDKSREILEQIDHAFKKLKD